MKLRTVLLWILAAGLIGLGGAQAQSLAVSVNACVNGPIGEQAIAACSAALQDPSLSADQRAALLAKRATLLVNMGRHERAIADLDEALRVSPNMPRDLRVGVLAMRGMARLKLGQEDLAFADFDRALQLNPNLAMLYMARGIAYLAKHELDRAIADFDAAIRLEPRDPDLVVMRALAFALKGDYERALADVEATLRLEPRKSTAYALRGVIHLKKENYDQAIADMTHAMTLGESADTVGEGLREARGAKAALALRQPPSASATRPELIRRIALVIGNGTYQHIGRLANAENDAADIGQALIGMGYKVFGHPKTNFTRVQLEAEIDAFQRAAADADTALIWYAGHGQEFREETEVGRNWLIPVDARIEKPSDIYANGVAMSRLINAAVPAKHLRLVVIDACRNSSLPSATRATRPRLAVEQRSGMMIVFSTRAGTVALDGEGRNSPFAAAFLDATRDKSHLDVRQFFGAVARGTLERTKNAQEPELLVRLQTDTALPLEPKQ